MFTFFFVGSTGADNFMGFGSKKFIWTVKVHWHGPSNKGYFQRGRLTGLLVMLV